jgi:isoleucyl-tRNA synthetase
MVLAADDAERLAPFVDIIGDEVNVKEVVLTTDVAAHGEFEVAVNARVAGPRLGRDVQNVIRAVKAGQWTTTPSGRIEAAGIELLDTEYDRRLVARDTGAAGELPGGTGLVVLDTHVTPALAAEGIARDLVRLVQQARRDAGLHVSDRIALTVDAPEEAVAAARTHDAYVAAETLALDVRYAPVADGTAGTVGDDIEVRVAVEKPGPGLTSRPNRAIIES